jgi:hypothetical protein
LKPGNAGRAKGPDFWCAFEDGEVMVIGGEPVNTNYDPGPSEKAVSKGEGGNLPRSLRLRHRFFSVSLPVKPVGEPDAGDRHVRFDERG